MSLAKSRRVAAVALIATAAMAGSLGGCTIDATGLMEAAVGDQGTVAPSASAAEPEPTTTVLSSEGVTALNAVFPAETDPDYEFSDDPQSNSEFWLAEQFPDQWALGVRAVSGAYVEAYNYGDPPHYAVMVQYIDGVRYEGTSSLPLGFRGQIDDPDTIPMDSYDALYSMYSGGPTSYSEIGNIGQGGYTIEIKNGLNDRGTYTLIVRAPESNTTDLNVKFSKDFGSIDEAMAWLEASDFRVDVGDRVLSAGEIANITAVEFSGAGVNIEASLYNSEAGELVPVS